MYNEDTLEEILAIGRGPTVELDWEDLPPKDDIIEQFKER